jgi:hypothetical protein
MCGVGYSIISAYYVKVRLNGGVAWVIPSAVDLFDGEGRVGPVRTIFVHERGEVLRARIVMKISHDPERILVSGIGYVVKRVVQPAHV